jgi:hypothetical protein
MGNTRSHVNLSRLTHQLASSGKPEVPGPAMEENGGQTPEDASATDELISPIGESESTKIVGFPAVVCPSRCLSP